MDMRGALAFDDFSGHYRIDVRVFESDCEATWVLLNEGLCTNRDGQGFDEGGPSTTVAV
jgi:hypothetical protein